MRGRSVGLAILMLALILATLVALRTWRLPSGQAAAVAPAARPVPGEDQPTDPMTAAGAAAAQRLAAAVRFQTISNETPSETSRHELMRFHDFLQASFPHAHAALTRESVNELSLLYTWTGRDPAAQPIVFMAHQDVVPVAPGSEHQWHAAPFAGEIKDDFVWGRGAWDDKGSLMSLLEAVERLCAAGRRPDRTIYLAFGHDEENSGEAGAHAIAQLFQARGIRPEFVLDEGLLIAEGMLPGLDPPVALIGIAEKGAVTLKVTAKAVPGHSSMPGSRTAIGTLAKALTTLELAPFPAAIDGVAAEMFAAVAPQMHGLNRVALGNRWLFDPILRWQLERSPATNALLRTTTAITMIRGGDKQNVLPETAEAWINFRTLPGDTSARVFDHTRRVIDDPDIRIEILPQVSEASRVSSTTSNAYREIADAVRAAFPGVVVAPGLVIAATDSRRFVGIADNVYRFEPVRARPEDLARFHGTDERVSIANYLEMIRFYETLMSRAAGVH